MEGTPWKKCWTLSRWDDPGAPEEPQFLDAEQAEALIEQAREQGIDLLGEGGLLKQMTKALLERALAEEVTDHLGYEVGDPAGDGRGDSRNGYTAKKLLTEAGTIDLEVPRDRNGTHEPQIVARGSGPWTASTRS